MFDGVLPTGGPFGVVMQVIECFLLRAGGQTPG
jgi:hypothetical protein